MKINELVEDWRQRASHYDGCDREATKNKQYVIAAQQAGLACAFRVCANELETQLQIEEKP